MLRKGVKRKKALEMSAYLFSDQDLCRLIIPLVVEQILAITVGMVDTMMVSSVGEAATSGVSLVDMINVLLINVFAAVSTGGAVVSSQFLGQKNKERACEAANQLLIVTGVVALVVMGGTILFRRGFLTLLYGGIEADVMKYALIYLILSALSYPFLAVYNSCAALLRSMGNSKISMQASIIMNVINVVGDAFFIFVLHLGVAGAAAASLISRMVACVILVYRLMDKTLDIHINTEHFGWNGALVKRILHIGIPGGIESSIFQLGRVLVVSMITLFGTSQIAANAVANNLDSLGVLPGQAMNLAVITVIGRCVGAGDYVQADYYAKKMMKLTYMINGLCCIAVILSLPLTLKLYGLSSDTLNLAAVLVTIHNGCGMLLWPASFTLPNILRAANDVKFPMITSVMTMVIVRLGMGYILAVVMGYGAVGIWTAMVCDWIFRVFFFVGRYRSGKWKTLFV